MQLFIPVWLNDLEPKDIKKENFLKLFTFPSLMFYTLATMNFLQCTYFGSSTLWWNSLANSFIIYTVSSFPIINKQNLSIQQQLSVSQVYYKCAVLHNVSMEFKRNFLFVYFVYIVTKVCVGLLVQTSNSHRTGS